MSNITIKLPHPLRRKGSTRVERLLKALDPGYFRIDDRSMQDLLVAAHRYSSMLTWFDATDRPDGDWTCFWETEALTYLAVLSAIDLEQLRKTYEDADYALGLLLESQEPGESQQEKDAYRRLAEILYSMAEGLEERYLKLVAIRHPMQHLLLKLINRDHERDTEEIEGILIRLIELHKAADDKLVTNKYDRFIHPDKRWSLGDQTDYARIMALPRAENPRGQLRGIFLRFYNTYVVLRSSAQRAFDQELARMEKTEAEEFRIVQPHISLFIAFLRLFHYAQDSLNELVKRQLDFYYERVLALRPAPPKPDTVFLIFTLAKNFEPQWVEKGAQLFGGKDKKGRPLFYETVKDWVISQAKLEEVKGFYLPSSIYSFNYDIGTPFSQNKKTILGANYPLPLKTDGVRAFADEAAAEEQEIGFVIASPQLLLQEGKRLIEITITDVATASLNGDLLNVYLSGEKGWSDALLNATITTTTPITIPLSTSLPSFPAFTCAVNGTTLTLTISLPKDFPPLLPIKENPMTSLPAVKLTLKKEKLLEIGQDYKNLISHSINKTFSISVAVEGVSKNLILQTDQGVFNGTQQIMPFGPTAPKEARFYVGFAEAFLKKLDRVRLRPNWIEPFANQTQINDYYAGYKIMDGTPAEVPPLISPSIATQVDILSANAFINTGVLTMVSPFTPYTDIPNLEVYVTNFFRDSTAKADFRQYDPSIRRGFLLITFQGDLHHRIFTERLALKSIDADPITTDLPNPPYTPTFNSIELDYLSNEQDMEDDVDEFFYLHPFGGFERAEKQASYEPNLPMSYNFAKVSLFKDFLIENPAGPRRGHLYLGFSGLKPNSSLSLLVQTVEGSEKKADEDPPKIEWACLAKNNTWLPIAPDKILLDSTRGLSRTGIIQMSVPAEISSEGNTLLNPALFWLRATGVEQSSPTRRLAAALPDLAYLHAQVIEARFLDTSNNDYSHLAEGMPAGSISKLSLSRSAIKKIEQPFGSFGGRLPESEGMAFYNRVSERLRHRDRAVTVWDYEHLLLEAFPDIAAVKCIPHTQYPIFPASELAPGSVTVAVIPDLKKRSGTSRERPRFPKGDLDDMRDFLLERACLFLSAEPKPITEPKAEPTLYVTNAQYEVIEVTITIILKPEALDVAFFELQLGKDLHRFLSPWLSVDGAAPAFGQNLRRSRLITFVEELSYVEYVNVDNLEIKKNGTTQTVEIIRPSAAHSILCSAVEHKITAVIS